MFFEQVSKQIDVAERYSCLQHCSHNLYLVSISCSPSYLTDDWELKQCVGRLKLLAKRMRAEEMAQQIIIILSTEFGISSNLLLQLCITEHLSMMCK